MKWKERYVKEQEESCLVCVAEININSERVIFKGSCINTDMIPKMLIWMHWIPMNTIQIEVFFFLFEILQSNLRDRK